MTSKNSVGRTILYWMMQAIMIMSLIVFAYMAPRIDSTFFPVVTDFKITKLYQDPEGRYLRAWGVMTKERSECRRIEVMVFSSPEGEITPSKNFPILYEEPIIVPNRPSGSQEWGPWKIVRPDLPLGPIVNFQVRHRCNFMWETTTDLGSYPTKDLFPHAKIGE